jgi:hypothetical protein
MIMEIIMEIIGATITEIWMVKTRVMKMVILTDKILEMEMEIIMDSIMV